MIICRTILGVAMGFHLRRKLRQVRSIAAEVVFRKHCILGEGNVVAGDESYLGYEATGGVTEVPHDDTKIPPLP
jgi:hypothetical protein